MTSAGPLVSGLTWLGFGHEETTLGGGYRMTRRNEDATDEGNVVRQEAATIAKRAPF